MKIPNSRIIALLSSTLIILLAIFFKTTVPSTQAEAPPAACTTNCQPDNDSDGDVDFVDIFNLATHKLASIFNLSKALSLFNTSNDATPTPPASTCNQPCDKDSNCNHNSYICSSQKIWQDATNNVSDEKVPGSSGEISSLTIYDDGNIKNQYLSKGGKVWNRNSANDWSSWTDITNTELNSVGSGPITSYQIYTDSDSTIKYHLVRDGILYYKDNGLLPEYNDWSVSHKADAAGNGTLLSFSVVINSNGIKNQHVVKSGQILTRRRNNGAWSGWANNTEFVKGIGADTGNIKSFSSQVVNGEVVQFFARGDQLWSRVGQPTAKVCRLAANPKDNTCTP